MGEITTLARAANNSNSLRTVIPMFIIKQWGLRPGDHLDWSIDIHGNQKVAVVIRAVKVSKSRGKLSPRISKKKLGS